MEFWKRFWKVRRRPREKVKEEFVLCPHCGKGGTIPYNSLGWRRCILCHQIRLDSKQQPPVKEVEEFTSVIRRPVAIAGKISHFRPKVTEVALRIEWSNEEPPNS